jgi:hypothetical protein
MMNAYMDLVGKPLGRSRRSGKIILKYIFEKYDGVVRNVLIWLRIGDQWRAHVNTIMKYRVQKMLRNS